MPVFPGNNLAKTAVCGIMETYKCMRQKHSKMIIGVEDMKRKFTVFLIAMMVLGMVLTTAPSVRATDTETVPPEETATVPVEAEAPSENASPEGAVWDLTDGVLTISGTGAMDDYTSASSVPWYSQRATIKSVVIRNGITRIGSRAFYNCTALENVTIANTVTEIGEWAFHGNTALAQLHIPGSVATIEASALRNCSGLTNLSFESNAPTAGNYALNGVPSGLTITCYEGTSGWDSTPWSTYAINALHVGQ